MVLSLGPGVLPVDHATAVRASSSTVFAALVMRTAYGPTLAWAGLDEHASGHHLGDLVADQGLRVSRRLALEQTRAAVRALTSAVRGPPSAGAADRTVVPSALVRRTPRGATMVAEPRRSPTSAAVS